MENDESLRESLGGALRDRKKELEALRRGSELLRLEMKQSRETVERSRELIRRTDDLLANIYQDQQIGRPQSARAFFLGRNPRVGYLADAPAAKSRLDGGGLLFWPRAERVGGLGPLRGPFFHR
jgi:hypothetical protein